MMVKNILVVSGDDAFLRRLENDFLELTDRYNLFVAGDGPRGLEILRTKEIDFVAQSLILPRMDGIQFLTSLRRIKPNVPIVIMVSEESTQMGDVFLRMGVLQVLVEPVTTNRLTECIQEILFLKSQEGRLKGISLINFLQLMEMERKTYLLEVRSVDGNRGLFYFHEGDLYDALCGELTGQEAAVLMINWDNVEIRFRTPPMEKVRKRIFKSLMALLMDTALLKDEKEKTTDDDDDDDDLSRAFQANRPESKGKPLNLEQKSVEPLRSTIALEGRAKSEPVSSGQSRNAEEFMRQLFKIRGVRSVLRLGKDGEVVLEVGAWAGLDVARFAKAVIMVHGGAGRMIQELHMARLESFVLEADGIVIMCLPSGEYLLTILAQDSSMLGVIRQKALKVASEMEWLS
ncbi:MAG: response regulator [Thermodesulfobacteriota bacterium]